MSEDRQMSLLFGLLSMAVAIALLTYALSNS